MLRVVADILRHRRTKGWLVGGSVRDRELGRYSPDLDVVVADDPATVARELAARLSSPWFGLSPRHGAYRVLGPDGHIDVAALRGTGIVDDLGQRDFTINAMAAEIGSDAVIDPFGGLEHLRQRRLVAVSEHIFADDPLRLMRAPRFCHVLGFRLDSRLEAAIRAEAPALGRGAAERVAGEMALTLSESPSPAAVRLWHRLGLLDVVLPGVAEPELLPAALLTLGRLDEILAHPKTWFPAVSEALSERLALPVDGAFDRRVALRLAALTHRLSSVEAVTAARRLRLSSAAISLLGTVAACFEQQRCGARALEDAAASNRSAVLFLWEAAPWEPEVITLAFAGAEASGGRSATEEAFTRGPLRLLALWADRATRGVPRPPVDGDLLMRELNLDPGPLLGGVLRDVRLAWEAGEVRTLPDALEVARGALRCS